VSFVRPEIAATLRRWREVLVALAAALVGLWIASLGGLVTLSIGGIVVVAALALALLAWRRMRFRFDVAAPGVVEIDESRISYMGPIMGGSVSLAELVEIDVIDVAGSRRCWRLHQQDGQALLIPLAAAGAEALYDHFATLPGADPQAFFEALDGDVTRARMVWRHPRREARTSLT
jgi:hypothetical protein